MRTVDRAGAPLDAVTLPDHLRPGLRLVFAGINPGERSARAGHHYAHPTNRFWRALCDSGLVPERIAPEEDASLLGYGIGLTNLVERASREATELGRAELREGLAALERKMRRARPLLLCVNGKSAYEAAIGRRLALGPQPERLGGVPVYLAPSPSGRNAAHGLRDLVRHYREVAALVERLAARRVGSHG